MSPRKSRTGILPLATTAAFEAAWAAYPSSGRLRSSRAEAFPVWTAAAREVSETALLAAVVRYAQGDKDHRRETGAPGFHRWLKWGRWEHWLPPTGAPVIQRIFPDAALRAAFAQDFPDERTRRWFDRSTWEADERVFTAAWPVAADWWGGPFSDWARRWGIRSWRVPG